MAVNDTQDAEASSVLPPKNNYQTDRQGNGTTQRMAAPYHTDPTLSGFRETSARVVDDVMNNNVDPKQAAQANAAVSNGIAAVKVQHAILKGADQLKDPELQRLSADLLGGESGKRFHGLIDARDRQRQITADRADGAQGDQSHQG